MRVIRRIGALFSDSRYKKTLAILTFVAILVGAAWKVYVYIYPSKSSAPTPTPVIEQRVNGSGTAIIHTGTGDVYTGISPEKFQALSEELGVTRTALKTFFNILQHKDVSAEEYDSTLRKIAKTYKELEERLELFSSTDPTVTAYKEKAKEFLRSGDFEQAESLLNKAVFQDLETAKRVEEIAEARMLSAAASMAEIGDLKKIQLDYDQAASYYRQASESVPQGNDLILAEYLEKWGLASYESCVYGAAEHPLIRALMIYEKVLGPEHPDVATSLNNLAGIYHEQGKYAEAEPLFKRSLAVCEKVLGPEHPDVAQSLNNLAGLYQKQGKYAEAEPLFKRSLTIREKVLGPEHPDVAMVCRNMAKLYRKIGKREEAERLEKRASEIIAKVVPSNIGN
jgi:tetratricopeptide (TPR) repeat protein